MQERRKKPRRRTFKLGTVVLPDDGRSVLPCPVCARPFDRTAGIDCLVRSVSGTGAALEFASALDMPNDFTLLIKTDNVKRSCHVAWRRDRRIGVRFA